MLYGNLTLLGLAFYSENTALRGGGAMHIRGGRFIISGSAQFARNEADTGGAIHSRYSVATLNGDVVEFENNVANDDGGAVYSVTSQIVTTTKLLNFAYNTARGRGGAVYVINSYYIQLELVSANFTNNTARECGGAVYVQKGMNVSFKNILATGNSESAFCMLGGRVEFSGTTVISKNSGTLGGGLTIIVSENHSQAIPYSIATD